MAGDGKTLAGSRKEAVRTRIQALCSQAFCIDRLLIIVFGDATDKCLLLDDANQNGMVADRA